MDEAASHSTTSAAEMVEPQVADMAGGGGTAGKNAKPPSSTSIPKLSKQPSIPSLPPPSLSSKRATTSAVNSPKPSRESSPVRPQLKSAPPSRPGVGQPRKNSKEVSPTRPAVTSSISASSIPTAPRTLSAATTPQLAPVPFDPAIAAPVPQKPANNESKDPPRWPVSPRLKSPPPSIRNTAGPRKGDQELPSVNVQRSTTTPETRQVDGESEDSLTVPGMRTPARGASGASSTLETVQEISQPSTPAQEFEGPRDMDEVPAQMTERGSMLSSATRKNAEPKGVKVANESGSESGGKGEIKMRATSTTLSTAVRPNTNLPVKSFSVSAAAGRGKPSGEGSTRNMTVETETVSSIPQVAVGGGAGGPGVNGSIRAKPSTETIRPKKEKKKIPRKAPSVTSGTGEQHYLSQPHSRLHLCRSARLLSDRTPSTLQTMAAQSYALPVDLGGSAASNPQTPAQARRPSLNLYTTSAMLMRRPHLASSKADIFEAKIASAVDEANSSDSEETFVYESNPPEVNDRPRRYHSRTPSATSMASQVDGRVNGRSVHAMDGVHTVALKKSMKFANTYNNAPTEAGTGEDDGRGTARSAMGTGRGSTHHHHIGRWGRNGGNGHPSLFDTESPFPNVAKSKLIGNSLRHSSRPTSPRANKMTNGKKGGPNMSMYDVDDSAAADDERTPLIQSTPRSNRSGRYRRPGSSSLRQLEHQAARQYQSFFGRFAGCLVLTLMILLAISGAVGFMFATTQPLSRVKVVAIKNVLASRQELMLDMMVVARNPNIVDVTVESMDLEVFAKSKHAGSDSEWYKRPSKGGKASEADGLEWHDNDPHGLPDYDDPGETATLTLGQIVQLDSPLSFDGSPFKSSLSHATGSMRLDKPGNTTGTPGGSDQTERWLQVLRYDFTLRVKGVLKYQLPLSQRVRSVSVDYSVLVKPSETTGAKDGEGAVHTTVEENR